MNNNKIDIFDRLDIIETRINNKKEQIYNKIKVATKNFIKNLFKTTIRFLYQRFKDIVLATRETKVMIKYQYNNNEKIVEIKKDLKKYLFINVIRYLYTNQKLFMQERYYDSKSLQTIYAVCKMFFVPLEYIR